MYAIFKKSNLDINDCVSTTPSRYVATITGKAWRNFSTRAKARAFKKTLKTPTNYAIVTDFLGAQKFNGDVVLTGIVVR